MSAVAKNWKSSSGWGIDTSADSPHEGYFRDCHTIDPSEVAEAWDRLAQDTRVLEFQLLPVALHKAFIAALAKRINK